MRASGCASKPKRRRCAAAAGWDEEKIAVATNLVKKTIEDAASADDAGATLNEQFGVLMAAAADPKDGLVATGKMTQERYDAFVGELTKMRDAALKTVKGAVSPIAAAVNERDAINEIDAIKDENKTDVHRATRAELEVSLTKKLVKMMKDGKKVVVFDEFGRRWEVLSVEKGGMHVLGAGLARKKTAVIGYGAETHRPFSLTKERSDEAKAVLGAMSDAQKVNTDSMKQVVEMHGKGNIDAEHLGKALQYSRAGHVVDGREFTIGEVGELVAMKQKQEREWAESAAKLRRQRNSGKPTSEARRASLERKLDELERKVDYLREVLYGSGRKSLIPGLRRESLVDAYFAMLDSASSHRGTRKIYLSVMKAFGGKVSWGRVHRTYEAIRAKFATRDVFVEDGRKFLGIGDDTPLIGKTLKRAHALYDLIVGADEDALRIRDMDVPKAVRDEVERMLRSHVTGTNLLPASSVSDFVRLVSALRMLPANVEIDEDSGEIMLDSQRGTEQALTNYLVLMALTSQARTMMSLTDLVASLPGSETETKSLDEYMQDLLGQYVANQREDDSASILNAAEPVAHNPVLFRAAEYMIRVADFNTAGDYYFSDAEVDVVLGRFEAESSLVRLLDPKRKNTAAGRRAELKRLGRAIMDMSHVQRLATVLIDMNDTADPNASKAGAGLKPQRASDVRRVLSGSQTAKQAWVDILTLAEGMVDNPLYP